MIPAEIVVGMLEHCPFGALNGLIRACRLTSRVHVDPARFAVRTTFTRDDLSLLPNGVKHGICTERGNHATAYVKYKRGKMAQWRIVGGIWSRSGSAKKCRTVSRRMLDDVMVICEYATPDIYCMIVFNGNVNMTWIDGQKILYRVNMGTHPPAADGYLLTWYDRQSWSLRKITRDVKMPSYLDDL